MVVRRLKRSFLTRVGRRARYIYLRLILLPETPHRVALGLAVGVFFGLLPVIPFQTILSVLLAYILKGSKAAAALGTWVTNPLTIPPFYALFYYLGRALTPFGRGTDLPEGWKFSDLMNLGADMALAALFGGLMLAVIMAPLAYMFTFKHIGRLQTWEREKLRIKLGLTA